MSTVSLVSILLNCPILRGPRINYQELPLTCQYPRQQTWNSYWLNFDLYMQVRNDCQLYAWVIIYDAWKYNNYFKYNMHTHVKCHASTVYIHTHPLVCGGGGEGSFKRVKFTLHMCTHTTYPVNKLKILVEWGGKGVCLWVKFHSSDLSNEHCPLLESGPPEYMKKQK